MEFGVLGSLDVRRSGEQVVLGSYKQRSLLALLLIHVNEVVSADRIIDELWGDELLPGRQNALWVHMSNLRSAIDPRPRKSDGILQTRAPGYMLNISPELIDAGRFQLLVAEGRRLLDLDPAAASIALGESLDLWRGRPYADVAYESFAQVEIGRLEELRLEAVELRVDADLRRGVAGELIGELQSLAAQHPLRERFTALLMLALYRAGRQSESLRAFERLRLRLRDELGIVPSPALADLERRILAGDRSLENDKVVSDGRTRLAMRGYEVRERIGEGNLGPMYRAYQPALGREVAITVLGADVANDPAFIRQFDAEAALIARLEHPHIVPLYDYWREPDAAYLVTRDVRGGTLADAVARRRIDAGDAVRVVREIGSALSLAHRRGVVHGAINPTSILIDDGGGAYLRDFTLAADERTWSATPTETDGEDAWVFVAPELRNGAPISPHSDTYSLAAVLRYALAGQRSTDMISGDLPIGIAEVIERATTSAIDRRFDDAGALVDALDAVAGGSPGPDDRRTDLANPYKGLYPFAEADSADFFGRERLVERLVARVGEPGPRGRFLAVVGPSGCGKSSVMHAGLVPALRNGAVQGSHRWFITTFTPGGLPFEELHGALLRVAVGPPLDLLDQLTAGDDGIRQAVQRLLPDDDTQLLIVIDQLEELFTQCDSTTVHSFLDAMASAVNDPHGRVRVAVTLRADFYDRPLRYRGIGELLRHGTELVTPMSPHEVERAITGPAERVGVRFDRGLVAEIVADVARHPDALPLLQYALTEMYERRRHRTVEPAAYDEVGRLAAALGRRAEDVYRSFDADEQNVTRQVLLRMITIGEGTEVLRRRVARQDLAVLGEPTVDTILERLGAHRLVSFDHDPVTRGPTVAIAHEALLTEWHRLRAWIDASREDLRLERQLAAAAGEWRTADRHDEYVLRGTRLDRLAEWSATTDLALDALERDFLQASVERREEDDATEKQRLVEADMLRARSRRRTRLLVASALVVAMTTALTAYAMNQRAEAQRLAGQLADTGEARRLAAVATLTAQDAPETAMLLAMQSLDSSARLGIPAVVEAEEALHWSLQAARVPYGHADAPVEVRVGPNGPTGIVRLPMRDLVSLATEHLGSRRLTADDCTRFEITPCPSHDRSQWPMIPTEPVRPELPAQNDRPLGGTRITVTGALDPAAVEGDLAAFTERTGIEISYETPSLDANTDAMSARGVPLDLTVFPRAAGVRESAEGGDLIDLGTYLDPEHARAEFGDYAVDAVSVAGHYYAAPMFAGMKGLVWYPLHEFAAAGYAPPRTWAELVALSHRMVDDGRTPWCMGFESEAFSGWPGTDWIEGLVLRIGGVDVYDRWMSGDLPFDGPIVRGAFDLFGQIASSPGFVRYGTKAISRTSQFDAMDHLTTDPPGCWMNYAGDWMANNARAATGGAAGFFVLPPLQAGGDTPVIDSPAMIGAFRDRPEVREFVRWMLDPSWGSRWASDPNLTFLSPNVHFDPANCVAPGLSDDLNAVRVQLCQLQHDTLVAGLQRPDASDEMPVEIGGVSGTGQRGAFLQALLDYVDEGPTNLTHILTSIDAARP